MDSCSAGFRGFNWRFNAFPFWVVPPQKQEPPNPSPTLEGIPRTIADHPCMAYMYLHWGGSRGPYLHGLGLVLMVLSLAL